MFLPTFFYFYTENTRMNLKGVVFLFMPKAEQCLRGSYLILARGVPGPTMTTRHEDPLGKRCGRITVAVVCLPSLSTSIAKSGNSAWISSLEGAMRRSNERPKRNFRRFGEDSVIRIWKCLDILYSPFSYLENETKEWQLVWPEQFNTHIWEFRKEFSRRNDLFNSMQEYSYLLLKILFKK